jgi:urocanate hydratase
VEQYYESETDARIYYKNFSQASTSSALQQNSLINQGQTKAPVASQLEPSVKLAPTDAPTSTLQAI